MKYRFYAQRLFSFRWSERVSFYKEKVGLPLKFEDKTMGWAEFDLDGVSLAIERQDRNDPESESLVGRFVGVSIQVDDIESTYKELNEKGVKFIDRSEKQPWGGVLVNFEDPDKNIITLLGGDNA